MAQNDRIARGPGYGGPRGASALLAALRREQGRITRHVMEPVAHHWPGVGARDAQVFYQLDRKEILEQKTGTRVG